MIPVVLTLFLAIGFGWYNALTASQYGETIITGFNLLPRALIILAGLLMLDVALVFVGYNCGAFLKNYLHHTEHWIAIISMFLIVMRMTYDFRNHVFGERTAKDLKIAPAIYYSMLSLVYALDMGCCSCWLKCPLQLTSKCYIVTSLLFIVLGMVIGYKRRIKTGNLIYQVATFILFIAVILAVFYR